ncbi:MAG: methionine adenosyltransferase [Clostridia bacterium]|nr:methionine adenosyltransferase [Clostridia bacterium]
MAKHFFTSESVTEGHPDKLCDRIADAVLDAHLQADPFSRVACEVATKTGFVLLFGEITSAGTVDYTSIVRRVVREVGYTDSSLGFDGNTCAVMTALETQSPDIAMGVDRAMETRGTGEEDTGAGDQGMMFGFACDENEEFMPMPIALAHRLTARLTQVRKEGILPFLRPDGKAQVTVGYENGVPVEISTVVLSTQHAPDVDMETLRKAVLDKVILPVLPKELLREDTRFLINPTGRFVIGGPQGDSGLTGRKIIVDTYGGYARHGGGAFSGKDPTKVDRSASYMARYIAKNLVASGLCRTCEIQLAYAIGVANPVSVRVDTFGTGIREEEDLEKIVRGFFDLRPSAIISQLQLRRPIYEKTTNYGHFGRNDPDFLWEDTSRAEELFRFAQTIH